MTRELEPAYPVRRPEQRAVGVGLCHQRNLAASGPPAPRGIGTKLTRRTKKQAITSARPWTVLTIRKITDIEQHSTFSSPDTLCSRRTELLKGPNKVAVPKSQSEKDGLPVRELSFDARNPRLVEYGDLSELPESEHIKLLWKRMAVDEVLLSIATDGFWDYEPLIVCKEDGKWVVIEGNRRLAAVKILLSPKLQKDLSVEGVPELTDDIKQTLDPLPVLKVAHRQDVWRYLGFKHVNGPAKWRSYAKAQYIAFVRNTAKPKPSLAEIAQQIGDRHRTVQRLYRALMVIEQAEDGGVYKREWCYKRQIAFSHLMTALDYDGFADFIGLAEKEAEDPKPVSPKKLTGLGEICVWLWGDNRGDGIRPVIESQNPDLRRLEQVLKNREALAALRAGHGLNVAWDISKGDDVVFEDALGDAKTALVKAQGRVSSGYRGEPHLLALADTIADMSSDLADTMHRKANESRPRRGTRTAPA